MHLPMYVQGSPNAMLVEFEDNHSLHALVDTGRFNELLLECYRRRDSKPKREQRPRPPMADLFSELKARK